MLDAVKKELRRLTVEADQIEQAITKKTRRTRSGGGRLTRDQVYDIVRAAEKPLTPAEVHELVRQQGVNASLNAVRNHLIRLADQNGSLTRTDDGRFMASFVPPRVGEPGDFAAGANDDIPF
jgi:hypothetical protein